MVDDLSVVLVSNRGPVSFVEDGDGFGITRGAGGMAGALDPVARRLGDRALWIAAATSEVDKAALAASFYGRTKRFMEQLTAFAARRGGAQRIAVRFVNVLGRFRFASPPGRFLLFQTLFPLPTLMLLMLLMLVFLLKLA